MVSQPIDEIDSAIEVRRRHAVADHPNEDEEKLEKHEADDHQGEHAREGAPGSAANQGSAPPGSNFKGRTFCSIRPHFSFLQHTTCCLYRLPKEISEMVGQTCRFAATTRRSSPTISEIPFGNHSSNPAWRLSQKNAHCSTSQRFDRSARRTRTSPPARRSRPRAPPGPKSNEWRGPF